MAAQLSVSVRNARLDSIETAIGVSAVLKMRTGSAPSTCATADSGTVIASYSLASDWMAAASAGSKSLNSTPLTVAASATGTLGHFRVYASDGTTCHLQGTISASGGGGDMIVDNTSVVSGQDVVISSFTLSDGNS